MKEIPNPADTEPRLEPRDAAAYGGLAEADLLLAPGGAGGFDLVRILRSARRHWRSIAVCLLLAGGGAAAYLYRAPRVFAAEALVELSARRPRILTQQAAVIEDPASSQQAEATLNTQLEKFKSAAILPDVLAAYRALDTADARPDAAVRTWLARGSDFKLVRRTRLVAISFRDRDPARAARACAAFAQGAEAHARAENRAQSDAAVAWLESQVRAQKGELEHADAALAEARQANGMDALEAERKTIQQALLQFNEALVGIESQVAREQELLRALDASELSPEHADKLPALLPHAEEIEAALRQWQAAVAERDALLSRYRKEHPEVVAREEAIARFREQARASLQRARGTTASNLELFKRQADRLREEKEQQSRRAAELERDIVDREAKLAALSRARNAADQSYQGVLTRVQEARLSADENTATVKLVGEPQVPETPVSPRPLLALATALLLGGALGLGVALLLDRRQDPLDGMRDIEVATGVKVLAVIPRCASKSRREVATATMTRRFSETAEAFAGLRSMLDSQAYRAHSQVVLVASSLPSEGKTMTCCNLATSCALNGQRTLLLDFDLRRPRIGAIYPPPQGRGDLLEYLRGAGGPAEAFVYEVDCPHLHVLSSQPVTKQTPAELMTRARVEELLAWARTCYDRIVIDGPPLALVSEALTLAGAADCVLVVTRPSVSRKRAVQHTVRQLRDVGVEAIAAVVNDVSPRAARYGDYGAYGAYRDHARSYFEADPRKEGPA